MRHRVYGRKLGRKTNHRKAMFRNMAVALFTHGQITTTVPKAKALRPFVEKLITMAKKGDLHNRRRAISALGGDKNMMVDEDGDGIERNRFGELQKAPKIIKHLFDEIGPRYEDRQGGYTRIIRLGQNRLGDGTDLCVIQLVGEEDDDAPQVAGNRTRRGKANKRMEFAAKLAKGEEAATAVADPEVEEQVTEEVPAAEEVSAEAEALADEAAEEKAPEAEAQEEKKDGE
ncbi:MAG: 50S ribosomal protein L17 [Planctomycetota bacterium]